MRTRRPPTGGTQNGDTDTTMTTTVNTTTGRVTATCDGCHTGHHRVTDMRTITVTTPTGAYGGRTMDVRVPGGVTGRTTPTRVSYPITTRVTVHVCAACAHRVDT